MSQLESTLEVLHLGTRTRRVVYRTLDHIEAPNWSPDGLFLLFNSNGHLYRLPAAGGAPVKIDTGPCTKLNNDHGITPDGRILIISDKSQADGRSRISILPAEGGVPKLITPQAPSYWHSISPDGKTHAYVAARNDRRVLNLYSCPFEGGAETRLTKGEWMDDGPDYSPDGRYIYFNSTRSGNMKLWRMDSEGGNPVQITFEADTRDWFAHPSPDGRVIVFLSFGTDVAVKDHPPNKDVTLRLLRPEGGAPEVIAHLFGGQGTINVPSWAPDSSAFAFVSYRLLPF